MKTGLFTYGMPDTLTGIGRYAQDLSYALRRLDLPLDIVLLSPYPNSRLQWYRDFPVHNVPSLKRLPSVMTKGHLVLSRATAKLGLDVLHDPCGIAPFLSDPGYTSRIVTIHDAIPLRRPDLQPLPTRVVYHTLLRWARWSSDAVITVSNHAKDELIQALNIPSNRIFVTPLGTNIPSLAQLSEWSLALPSALDRMGIRLPYFLWVGADSPRKNLARVLEAFELLRLEQPDIELVLVGPKNVRRATLPHGANHLGYVDQATLDLLYVGALGLLYPSLYEGFGVPIIEAMSHGTPVITSNTSSMPEVSGHAALIVDPYSVHDIRDAMKKCLNHDTRMELRFYGRLRAMQFRWDKTALDTYRVYQKFAALHRTPRNIGGLSS